MQRQGNGSCRGKGMGIHRDGMSKVRGLPRDNWSGVKSGPPGSIFACEIWTALAKSGPGIQKPAAVGE